MFDFRYHAISLIAVLVALAVGLVVGVAIGDKGLVSKGEKSVRQSLGANLREANAHIDDLNAKIAQDRQFDADAVPLLVAGKLSGRSIGLVFLGRNGPDVTDEVTNAVSEAGGQVVTTLVLNGAPQLSQVAEAAFGTPYTRLNSDRGLLQSFAQKIGRELVSGGRLIGQVRRALFSSSQGTLQPLDGVVVVREPASDLSPHDAALVKTFDEGFTHGLTSTRKVVPVVGVETTATDPSQVSWYRDHGMASVDDVDLLSGEAALVFTLTPGVDGAFGIKDSAEGMLPKIGTGT